MPRKIDALLAEYGESHQNPTNKAIHWVCVPVIVWTVAALLWSLPVPAVFAGAPNLTWLTPVLVGAILYYLVVSWRLAIGFTLYAMGCLWLIVFYENTFALPLWQFALIVFVIAWIGQFWGHKVEGKKPSFFKDVQFLLIGPAWLLHFLYKRAGISY
ncbi:MAG: DUF962 domain-containing protein [Paracoccaceae bacterium]